MVRTWYMYTELARTQRWYLTCISLACDGTHSLALVSQTPRRIATPHTWMHTLSHRVGSPPAGASGQVEARESRAFILPLGLCAASWPGTEAPPSSVDNGGVGTLA